VERARHDLNLSACIQRYLIKGMACALLFGLAVEMGRQLMKLSPTEVRAMATYCSMAEFVHSAVMASFIFLLINIEPNGSRLGIKARRAGAQDSAPTRRWW